MNKHIGSIVKYREKLNKNFVNISKIVLRLEIIRDCVLGNLTRKEVSKKYNIHRNTIRNIFIRFEKNVKEEYRTKEFLSGSYTQEEIITYYKGLDDLSRAPKSHSRIASQEQENIIKKLFETTNYGVKKMKTYIEMSLMNSDGRNKYVRELKPLKNITIAQIRGIYKRNNLKTKKVRNCSGKKSTTL